MLETGALLVLAAVAIGVAFFVAIPFLETRRPAPVSASDQELSSLLAERDRLITALQELDFDFTLGKIPAEAYPDQRSALLQRGADVLRRIDMLAPPIVPAASVTNAGDVEARIEAAVAARRADLAAQQTSVAPVDDEIESRVAARRSERADKSGGFCPNCGKPVLASDRFCPHCGRAIK